MTTPHLPSAEELAKNVKLFIHKGFWRQDVRAEIVTMILADRNAVLEAAAMAGRDAIDTAYGRNWTAKWQKGWKRARHRACFITAGEIFEDAIRALKKDL